MKSKINDIIVDYISSKNINGEVSYVIEYPKQQEFGDFSTNLAMVLSGKLKRKPIDIALEFIEFAKNNAIFEKIDTAGPGFINFYLSNAFIYKQVQDINKDYEGYFKPSTETKKIQIEFVSANPTGPLHIGHGRGAAIGDSIARILKYAGHKVEREYYINDAGLQMRMLGLSTFIRYKQLLGIEEQIPEDGYQGEYLIDIAKNIMMEYGDSLLSKSEDESISICKDRAGDVILKNIVNTLSHFRVNFDAFFNEQKLYNSGEVERSINYLNSKGYIYEKDGALWFKSTALGDDKDRVLKKSSGAYTYFASDIAYHKNKFLARNFDSVIDIWGADHHGYVNRMKSAIEAIGVDREKLSIILVQIVNLLRDGNKISMSTRKAQFIELDNVLEEVGVDAARFMFLSRSVDSHLDFDLELAKKQTNENPVYYVQYAYARIKNIFKQVDNNYSFENIDLNILKLKEEIDLAKSIIKFKSFIAKAQEELEPYFITKGLLDIAESLHRFYNHIRVMGSKEINERLFLLNAVASTIKLGFDLIGIEAKEKM
jgi:arginyl-tRNA synthetase